jgi:hypothetical protein
MLHTAMIYVAPELWFETATAELQDAATTYHETATARCGALAAQKGGVPASLCSGVPVGVHHVFVNARRFADQDIEDAASHGEIRYVAFANHVLSG